MFTGLIETKGRIAAIEPSATGRRLIVEASDWAYRPEAGASIAVNGCCLTVVESKDGRHQFDVIHRSLEMTTLGRLTVGDSANLERAATLDTLLGGHLVQGHVDGTGEILEIDDGTTGECGLQRRRAFVSTSWIEARSRWTGFR